MAEATALTADLWQSIVGSLKQRSPDGAEKRKEIRVGFRCRLMIYPYTAGHCGKPIAAWCRDLTKDGIGIVCQAPIHVGSQFVLYLPRPNSDQSPLCLLFVVIRSLRSRTGHSQIGARCLANVNQPHSIASIPVPAVKTAAPSRPTPLANSQHPMTKPPTPLNPEPPAPTDTMPGNRSTDADELHRIQDAILEGL